MAVLYSVWVPAVTFAHALGLALLLYSLEKVNGIVSKTWKKFRGSVSHSSKAEDEGRSEGGSPQIQEAGLSLLDREAPAKHARTAWVRGCSCTEGCYCLDRWEVASKAGTPADVEPMKVQYPADLSWSGVTCHVKDQKTLQMKQVLHSSEGRAHPGECLALLGPSGAGKSTLLDILSLRKTSGKITGEVLMNGRPLGVQFRRNSAYVAQEDCFVPTMSAWETLVFNAMLTLPKSVGPEERRERIESVLKIMGLWRSRDTQVGGALPGGILVRGLSGGEKRRLNIACALISAPSILFLDEPTTGLDSFAALNVMEHMRSLAGMGHTVIASIHQPRSAIWDMFDKCVVLSEGHCLYFGAPEHVLDWFDGRLHYSYSYQRDGAISDWLMDLVSVGFQKPLSYRHRSMCTYADVQRAAAAFIAESTARKPADEAASNRQPASQSVQPIASSARQSPTKLSQVMDADTPSTPHTGSSPVLGTPASPLEPARSLERIEVAPPVVKKSMQWASGRYAASWCTQFRVLLKRAVLGQLRNPTDTTSRLFLSTWVGVLAGLVFFNLTDGAESVEKRLALLFFLLLLFELLPFCYMSFYVADRRFFAADVANDLYHPSAYYIAAVIAGIPFVVVNSLCGSLSAYGLAGLRFQASALLINCAITALQSLISIQLQVFCVWLTPNQDLAYVLATGYVAASILLSGFYLRVSDMRLRLMRGLSYLSYTKYAMEAVSHGELAGMVYPSCDMAMQPLAAASPAPPAPGGLAGDGIPHGWVPGNAATRLARKLLQAAAHLPTSAQASPGAGTGAAALGAGALGHEAPRLSSDAYVASGGLTPKCDSTGDSLLRFWGYNLQVAHCAAILLGFYLLFHLGSYIALSKLYKQKR